MASFKALTYSLLLACSSAREFLKIQENMKDLSHKRPHVEELQCDTCISKSDNERVCITYGMFWEMGWEWDQEWYDDPETVDYWDGQYKLALEIYS